MHKAQAVAEHVFTQLTQNVEVSTCTLTSVEASKFRTLAEARTNMRDIETMVNKETASGTPYDKAKTLVSAFAGKDAKDIPSESREMVLAARKTVLDKDDRHNQLLRDAQSDVNFFYERAVPESKRTRGAGAGNDILNIRPR